MGKISTEKLKEKYFYEMGVTKFRRLRQIWVKIFGFWFFKDITPELARNQVKRVDADVHSQKDIETYMAKIMEINLDIQKPLWEIHVVEDYDDSTTIVFILIHHMLSDGMGIMSLITFLNDNHNPDNIKQHRDIPFISYYILPFLYIPIGIIKYTLCGIMCKGDPDMSPFVLKSGIQSMKKKYWESKQYELHWHTKNSTKYKKLNSKIHFQNTTFIKRNKRDYLWLH